MIRPIFVRHKGRLITSFIVATTGAIEQPRHGIASVDSHEPVWQAFHIIVFARFVAGLPRIRCIAVGL